MYISMIYLCPITNFMIIPFSFSNFLKFSPAKLKGNILTYFSIINYRYLYEPLAGKNREPWGIHVCRIESLRFLLLNAVIIPMTQNILGRLLEVEFLKVAATCFSSFSIFDALAAASWISNEDMVRSNVLKKSSHVGDISAALVINSNFHGILE